jgi:DDB1- and CUL4-associated factor 11
MTKPPTTWTPARRREMGNDEHQTTLHVRKTVEGGQGWWTITDSHLSPDNERLVLSSLLTPRYF